MEGGEVLVVFVWTWYTDVHTYHHAWEQQCTKVGVFLTCDAQFHYSADVPLVPAGVGAPCPTVLAHSHLLPSSWIQSGAAASLWW